MLGGAFIGEFRRTQPMEGAPAAADGCTALHACAGNGHAVCVELLLREKSIELLVRYAERTVGSG